MGGSSVKGIIERYGSDVTLMAGELAKKNAERKFIHEMLTEYGVPTDSANGEGMCLQNRILWALREREAVSAMLDNKRLGYAVYHTGLHKWHPFTLTGDEAWERCTVEKCGVFRTEFPVTGQQRTFENSIVSDFHENWITDDPDA